MRSEAGHEEDVRSLVERIVAKIDTGARVLLREPGRRSMPETIRLALVRGGQILPFDVSDGDWRRSQSPIGRERLARRLGAALGLQPPDQLVAPPRE